MTCAYRLPRSVADRLETALRGRKNAAACFALATWLGRFWSAPRRLLYSFPVDRRAIAGREDLGLSEARVRGAIAVLEEVGFLARYEPDPGKRYQRTAEGLHRRPLLFRFGEEFAVAFGKANAAAQTARGGQAPARRPISRPEAKRAPAVNLAPLGTASPAVRPERPTIWSERPTIGSASQVAQKQVLGGSRVIMGEERGGSALEAAIERLRRGIGL